MVRLLHSGWLRRKSDRYGLGLDIAIYIYEHRRAVKLLNPSKHSLGSWPISSDSKYTRIITPHMRPAALGASESISVGAN